VVRAGGLWLALLAVTFAHAEELTTSESNSTLNALFSPEEASKLSKTLPADQAVKFRVWWSNDPNPGVMVFVSPTDSGKPPRGWLELLRQRRLSWVAADGFGNREPSAQRVLVALMGLSLAQRAGALDRKRVYIGGMSGGGRIASMTATRFPQMFSGALYIVGANFSMPDDAKLRQLAAANRYVFITGNADFNHLDMRSVYSRYRKAGFDASLFMDIWGYAHEYPNVEQLGQAIAFLDER
jgi:pimeloyl-ACP methyl ester carboxylesterase